MKLRKQGNVMWVSKREWERTLERLADLESMVQSQQKEITSLKYPYGALKKAFAEEATSMKQERKEIFRTWNLNL